MFETAKPQSKPSSQPSRIHQVLLSACGDDVRQAAPVTSLGMENIGKRYGETAALTTVTVNFRPGIHTILGENGSGKSTMLKILSGVVAPSDGRVVLDGQTIVASSPRDMQNRGLSTVFQEVLIAPHRSVADNIFLGYDGFFLRSLDKSRRRAAAEGLLAVLGRFPIDLDAPAGSLALAAQQLVVIARAFMRLPSILLLDEATAALDYADRDLVFDAVEDYARAGNIVIFISHRMEEVKRLSDHVTVLRSGRIIETIERDGITSQRLLDLMAPEAHIHVE
ncbi:sugar ABC transporter ATP-binding protein [Phyllobacterium phragmitis]|uniref:Sugar ABC transporter ATP-binding protein n=1 Tax=Phyllobacterium phragmitis TaxID=2670329 RepID=A0A2S9IW50_9HYPH|nr:ATP-binding cassette domain-containing protein [Phyllobacterium phragmitis]PRD44747.1 sugar ABC transporter ATP-binding protein [Phyllobacterium phragmitis]